MMDPSSPREPPGSPPNGVAQSGHGLRPRTATMMRVAGVIIGLNEARKGQAGLDNLLLWFAILCVAGVDTAEAIALRVIDRIFGNGSSS